LLAIFSTEIVVLPPQILAQTEANFSLEIAESQSKKISEEQVKQLIENITKAGKKKDVEEISKYLAPFIYSEITVKTESASETIELNGIGEHQQYLKSEYQQVKETEELSESWQIDISADEQMAFVKRTRLVGVTTSDGRKLLISSDAKARLAIVEGELKVISMEEVAEVDLRP
jgi:hypothetical protein